MQMEDTLLMVFIGLVALALIIIAAGIGAVAWYLSILLREITVITQRLHEAGEAAAADVARLREGVIAGGGRIASAWDVFVALVASRLSPPKRRAPRREPRAHEPQEESAE
jgi:hypothetical protein